MNIDLTDAQWVKSRYSGNGGECIEIAPNFPGLVPVRDSKNPTGPALAFPATAFTSFLAAVKRGDLPTT